jgi:hypothetical protein
MNGHHTPGAAINFDVFVEFVLYLFHGVLELILFHEFIYLSGSDLCLTIFFLSLVLKTQPIHWTKRMVSTRLTKYHLFKVGLGISRTNADSQWNPSLQRISSNFLLWKRNDSLVVL